jgi:hypothetical protein
MELEMKQLINLFASLLLALPLVAHAGMFGKDDWEKDDCPKEHSLAWCLADFQGRSKGLYDQSQDEFTETLKKAGVTDPNQISELVLHNGLGVGVSLGNFMMGNMLGGGIFMLSAIMPGAGEQNRKSPYMVIFDEPKGLNTKQMSLDFNSILRNSIELATPELCNKDNCAIDYGSGEMVFSDHPRNVPLYINKTPVVSMKQGAIHGIYLDRTKGGVNLAKLAFAISEKLPANYYWFIPAGHLGGNPLSMFLNQGKALFFVKPDPKNPVPVLPHLHS